MPPRDLTADDIADWLTPAAAVEILNSAFGKTDISRHALVTRLKNGMVQSAAGHSVWTGTQQQPKRKAPSLIQSSDWSHYEQSGADTVTFWVTADIKFYLGREYGTDNIVTVHHFAVRLEPQSVQAMIAHAPNKTSTKTESQDSADQKPKGPPVSSEHLKAWYDLYRRVYPEADDTEANALASARGMFPGKSVSRDRLRELRGDQKRGPKKRDG